jgi:CSLREA domain-containing protein
MKVFGARIGGLGDAGGGMRKRARVSTGGCRRRALALGACVLALGGAAGLARPANAAGTTYTVNSTADPGDGVCDATECTLREAIDAANANLGTDTIDFDLSGSPPYTITPATALPAITESVVIDGTTQAGYSSGSPVIELDGTQASLAGGINGANGLNLEAASTVRGLVVNRFTGPQRAGIVLGGSGGSVLEGNFIGTDAAGAAALGNEFGVRIIGNSDGNRVGGTTVATRNVISGNNLGVEIDGPTTGNIVEGNLVGTDSTGGASLANGEGVSVFGTGNTIGGTAAGAGNVISGNTFEGVMVYGSGNRVQGNLIGTDVDGTSALGNQTGVEARSSGTIGGTTPAARNVISGNRDGVIVRQGVAATIRENFIGTDSSGTGDVGNTGEGVWLDEASGTAIDDNVISGNYVGVEIARNGATDNTVRGNLIGLNAAGSSSLPNIFGVDISQGASGNDVGGTSAGDGNQIAYNSGGGVTVSGTGTGNRILGNSIHDNTSLGIDLLVSFGGVTPNDLGDPDSGPNGLQNFPVITSAANGGSGATISGTLNSTASTTFRLEFFASETCDSSGYGEGELYLGADSVTTDAGGDVSFASSVPTAIPSGWVVTATATDPDGNTSEFSACSGSAGSGNSPPTVLSAAADASGDEGSTLTTSGSFQDSNGDSLTISGAGAGSVVDNGDGTWSWSYEPDDNGTGTVTVTADDGNGGTVTDSFDWTADNVNPDVTLTAPTDGALYQVGASVGVSADLTDPGSADTHTCSIDWNDSSVTAGAVSESNGSGTCSGSHTYSAPGVYAVGVTVTDDDGGTGSASVLVVVYDPSGGFVTGGGWIDSPAGAYKPDATLTGHATFGFVSKYKKGATTPDGNTEFQFTAGNLSFHSSSYDWLVVSKGGGRAQFKGTGTINGSGSYGFMLWATDGSPDAFRIQIWDKNDGDAVVYDNGTDADGNDTSFATGQPLAGGSIVVHDK